MNQNNIPNKAEKKVLSRASALSLSFVAALIIILSGVWNLIGVSMSDAIALTMSGMLSMLVYVIAGGMCALLFLDFGKYLSAAAAISFLGVLAPSLLAKLPPAMSLMNALLSLFPVVCGVIIAMSMKKGARRTEAIVSAAAGTGLYTIAVILLSVFLSGQRLDAAELISAIDFIREEMIRTTEFQSVEIASEYGYDLSAVDVEALVNSVFNLLPSMLILVFVFGAFFSQLSLLALSRLCGVYENLENKDTEFKITKITAAVYSAAYVLTVFIPTGSNIAGAVSENLSMVLMPGLALYGFMSVLPRREGSMIRIGCLPLAGIAALLLFSPMLAYPVLSFMGVMLAFRTRNN